MDAAIFEKEYKQGDVPVTVKRVSENTLEVNEEEMTIEEFETKLEKGEITVEIDIKPEPEPEPEPEPTSEPTPSPPPSPNGERPYRAYGKEDLEMLLEQWRSVLAKDSTPIAQDTAYAQMDLIEQELKTRP